MIRLAVRCGPSRRSSCSPRWSSSRRAASRRSPGPDWVEYAIYGAEGELPDLGGVEAAAGEGMVEVRSETVPDDWADRWRDFHEPTVIAGGRVVIRPSWHDVAAGRCDRRPDRPRPGVRHRRASDDADVRGAACWPSPTKAVRAGPLADLGTGSAVLAIVAAKLGFAPVIGVDLELAALEAAAANAAANGVELGFERLNLREEPPPRGADDRGEPDRAAPARRRREAAAPTASGWSAPGLLAREAGDVEAAFAARGARARGQRLDSGDWAALLSRALTDPTSRGGMLRA